MKKILFLLLFFISLVASAETYYVKNGGSDVAAGTSHETAWATVAKVNATAFNPGDSVLFRCNDVWREYVSFSPPAGTAAGRVYYGSYQTGNKPLNQPLTGSSAWVCFLFNGYGNCALRLSSPSLPGRRRAILFSGRI